MNKNLKIILSVTAVLLTLGLIWSISGPIKFNKERDNRYIQVIADLQDIGALQKEFKVQTDSFASNIGTLIKFADTAQYVIKQRFDTTYYVSDARGIKIPQNKVFFREMGRVPVKDSVFKGRDYKGLANMKVGDKKAYKVDLNKMFDMSEDSTSYKTRYFFKVSAQKIDILDGLGENNIINELNEKKGIVDTEIYVGSLVTESTDGNWTPEYDYQAKKLKQQEEAQLKAKK